MKRIAIIADSHFDAHSRFEECCRLHDWIAEDLTSRGVDLIVHTGDVFERKSVASERNAVAAWLQKCAAIAPVILVRGNHDYFDAATGAGDLAIFRELTSRHPILVEEAAAVHLVAGVAVAAVAWPRKAHLLAKTSAGYEESEQIVGDAMRNVLRGLGDQLAQHDGPRILAMHAMVRGSVTSVGQPLVGCDLELGIEDLTLTRADLVALGHIHAGQSWTHNGVAIVYPGSPRRTTFGEVEDKGYIIAEIDGEIGQKVHWERVVVPATKMLLVQASWDHDDATGIGTFDDISKEKNWPGPDDIRDAEVRFRYRVVADRRDAARGAAIGNRDRWLDRGAAKVQVEEEVIATARARAPEIAAATTLDDKLAALWKMRGTEFSAERVTSLLTKVHQVEEEVAA